MEKIDDILDLPLRTILESYSAVQNLECGGYYGVCSDDLLTELFQKYNIDEEYPEAFSVENLVYDELLVSYDEELLDGDKLVMIRDNLGISKKNNRGGD